MEGRRLLCFFDDGLRLRLRSLSFDLLRFISLDLDLFFRSLSRDLDLLRSLSLSLSLSRDLSRSLSKKG